MNEFGTYTEQELLVLMSKDDEKAFRVIYVHFYHKIYKLALFLTKDSQVAEDVLQEIFVKLWLSRAKLAEVNDLNAYLMAITKNHIYNYFRKLNYHEKYIEYVLANAEHHEGTTSQTVDYNELHKRINRAVSNLPRQQRRVYELSRTEGLKFKDIARQLNISRETVKMHISNALRTIKAHLSDYKNLILTCLFVRKKTNKPF